MKWTRDVRGVTALAGAVVCALVLSAYGATVASAVAPGSTYDQVAFSDGFESGSSAWTPGGNGSASVLPAASHTGSSGLRFANSAGQYDVFQKTLPSPLMDSSISFSVRISSAAGVQEIAEVRDRSNSVQMWGLLYDGNQHGFWFYPRDATHATEIFTGSNTAPLDTWIQVEVQYTANGTGGAQIYINGQTQPAWGVSGDYTRTSNPQNLQIWNDAANTVDFDDVTVAVPTGSVATPPGAPTGVSGTPGDSQVGLSWTAPASDGGSAITGYRITPYIGAAAQAPTNTGSGATSATVTGLTNGTAYTFKVAAINTIGTGADSAASAAMTPTAAAATAPGRPPAAPTGTSGDGQVALTWSAPTSDGGSAITGYRITPSIGAAGQAPILTGSSATSHTVTGLANGTAYTFTVAAINNIGTGPDSASSLSITPTVGPYSSVVFSDLFETGSLSAWAGGIYGTGSATAAAAAARNGSYGLRLANSSGQYDVLVKSFASPMADSQTSFWLRIGSAAGTQEIAQARDAGSSQSMWALFYDGSRQGFYFYPTRGSTPTELFTGNNSATIGTWVNIAVQYTATATGGAQLYINGQTQASWGVSGDYRRTENLQRLQLWNDAANTVDFDDVNVAQPPGQGPGLPDPPTGVSGTPGDGQVNLSWSAPSSNGGGAITSYRITPSVNGVPQASIMTGSPTTSYTVTGLTNGSAYTFTVAAINSLGTGPESTPSAAVTPSLAAATVPGAPTNLVGTPGDGLVALTWSAPTSDGGSAITGYRVTAYIGGVAQPPILTGATATNYTVTGLSNGTAYTFTVAAISNRGSGSESTQSALVTPSVGRYSSVVFSDGFESGSLAAWPGGNLGPGSGTAATAAARNGSFGLRLTNASGQYDVLVKTFASPIVDSETSFWLRIGSEAGVQEVAQTRDASSSQIMWTLFYDGSRHGFWFYPTNGSGTPTELFTGINSVPVGGWHKLAVQYTAVASGGGAQLSVDGQTQASWGVSGDYSRSAHLQKLQIWNDVANTVDFDDIRVAIPSSQPAGLPGAPTNVTGLPDDRRVSLSWTAPTVDGGGITGYRVTAYVNGVAQTPIETGSSATSYLVTGLTNGTSYTFTVAAESSVGTGPESAASAPVTAAVLNAIQRENNLQGDPNWGNFGFPADPTALSAYGSRISVNHGQSIDFYATTTASTLTIDIFRMGWYNGAGARRVQSMGDFPGVNQPQALPNHTTGMISENWTRTATLDVPGTWTSGVYLARLLAPNGTGTFIFFVVRNDGGHEPIVFQTSVNTYQAYNEYGGVSLYSNNTNRSAFNGPHATKVSFDRPFVNGNGAGQFLAYEFPFVRWLEREGYDATYTTNVDTSTNVNPLTNHKVFLSVGHDEYWSKAMRDNVEAAIAARVNVGFFGGNEAYWQVRYEPNAAGTPNRVMVGYKDLADDSTVAWGPDPMWNVDNSVLTTLWRENLVNRPEEQMMGVMFGGEVNNNSPDSTVPGTINYDMIIQNASHWVYAGTGWTNGTRVPAMVGYEYDHYWNDAQTPPNVTVLSNTPLTNSETGEPDTANSTIYTAPSGAMVFAIGTIQWSWGLDSFGGGPAYVNAGVQRLTANVLSRFTQ